MVKTNYFNRFRKGKGKAKAKAKPKPRVMGGGMTFAQKVNKIISRNVENKITTSYSNTSPVCSVPTLATPVWYLQKDWNTKVFTIAQGAQEAQRIGNQIKLKRWVIKGIIHPQNIVANMVPNTQQGFVDIYFGRLNTNGELSSSLANLLDSGNTSEAPLGTMTQIFRRVNKDEYKIYYHKRFKVSPANSVSGLQATINNDFGLVKTFGFDVCKHICKGAVIKYNDNDNDPNNDMIRRLALWATWTPAVGDMGTNSNVQTLNHYYNISIQSYADYEDA